jgi:hypothetical protein
MNGFSHAPPNATRPRRKALLARIASILFWTVALAKFANAASTTQAPDVDDTVITHLKSHGFTVPAIIGHTDLTKPFATTSSWTLVIAQDNAPPPEISDFEEHGPIAICFVKDLAPDCSEKLYDNVPSEQRWFGTPFYIRDSRVVYAGPANMRPLLLLKTCGARSGDGNCGIATGLYGYDQRADRFYKAFGNVTGSNNNQDTRFVENGPLLGDVIVNYPTDNAPYTYWIEMYRQATSGRYVRVLRYRGSTRYGDGNPLAVIDSEMPVLLRHLGLWRSGDSLPIPTSKAEECAHPVMRKGEEWCK